MPSITGAISKVSVSSGMPNNPIKPNAKNAGMAFGIIPINPPRRDPRVIIIMILINRRANAKPLNCDVAISSETTISVAIVPVKTISKSGKSVFRYAKR